MDNRSGWNMHSVVDLVPSNDDDLRLTSALAVVDEYSTAMLGRPMAEAASLRTVAASPKARLADISGLAHQLDFILIPFGYLDPASYAEESAETKRRISTFADVISPMYDAYVLCPLEYYSLAHHIGSRARLPIMAPEKYLCIFQMLEMCLPVFREMKKDIADLKKQLELTIRAQQERERMRLLDPLMVGVSRAMGLDLNGTALVGPAWGPDLDEILLANFGLNPKEQQRQMIEESLAQLTDNPAMNTPSTSNLGPSHINMRLLAQVTRDQPEDIRNALLESLNGSFNWQWSPQTSAEAIRAGKIARLLMLYFSLQLRI